MTLKNKVSWGTQLAQSVDDVRVVGFQSHIGHRDYLRMKSLKINNQIDKRVSPGTE